MKKLSYIPVSLAKGSVHVYDINNIKLHVYNTCDPIDDVVFLIEKDSLIVVLEQPSFLDNARALESYIQTLNVKVYAKLLAYHMAGGSFLPDIPAYSTKNAEDYGQRGQGKMMVDNFTRQFSGIFDSELTRITNYIDEGKITIAGIDFQITKTAEAFDVALPQMNIAYLHMLGSASHSIVAGKEHAAVMMAQMRRCIDARYEMILSSHALPSNINDAKQKIKYLQELVFAAGRSKSASQLKQMIKKKFPSYKGEHYLDMTARFFFPESA